MKNISGFQIQWWLAAEKGIVMALLPAWGDKVTLKYGGKGP